MPTPGLAITVLAVEAPWSSAAGDILVRVTVDSQGFYGATDTWILGDAWSGFLAAVDVLYQNMEGEAVLESISPCEFRLTIRREDALGHLRAEGVVSVNSPDDGPRRIAHSLSFGLRWEFEGMREFAGNLRAQVRRVIDAARAGASTSPNS